MSIPDNSHTATVRHTHDYTTHTYTCTGFLYNSTLYIEQVTFLLLGFDFEMSDFEVMRNKISPSRESGGLTRCMRGIRIYGSQKKKKKKEKHSRL